MKQRRSPEQILRKAMRLHQDGKAQQAIPLYREALAQQPHHAEALHLLGLAHGALGALAAAENCLAQAVALNAAHPYYRNNLGEAYRRRGKLGEAVTEFTAALQLNPRFPQARYNLALTLKSAGRNSEAIEHYQNAIVLQPTYVSAHYNLGNALLDAGRYREAMQAFEAALRLQPEHFQAANNLGVAYRELEELDTAESYFRKAIAFNKDYTEAYQNLSGLYLKRGAMTEAQRFARRVAELEPNNALQRLHAELMMPPITPDHAFIDAYRAKAQEVLRQAIDARISFDWTHLRRSCPYPAFELAYHGRNDLELKRMYARLFQGLSQGRTPPPANAKPRVGFLVTHGHEGVFLKSMRGFFNNISTDAFDIVIVCSQEGGREIIAPKITNDAVRYVLLPRYVDEMIPVLERERLDMLFFWEIGSDSVNYLLPYLRLARIQISGWGWPLSSAIPTVDYHLSSVLLEPPDGAAHYSEQLILMETFQTYYYRPPAPQIAPSRAEANLPESGNVYLCSQNLKKLHPDMDAIFGAILERDPQGRIVIIRDKQPEITALLLKRLESAIPDVLDRIVFVPRMKEDAYLKTVAAADIVIDSLHHSGANTSYDAFAAGTPVVTLPTEFQRGRYTYAAYTKIGITECIAQTTEEYVEIAVRIATNKEYRNELGARIREQSDVLFEEIAAVREMETIIENMLFDNGKLRVEN